MSIANLMLNFAPVALVGETTTMVGYRPYTKDALRDLRTQFGQTHVFKNGMGRTIRSSKSRLRRAPSRSATRAWRLISRITGDIGDPCSMPRWCGRLTVSEKSPKTIRLRSSVAPSATTLSTRNYRGGCRSALSCSSYREPLTAQKAVRSLACSVMRAHEICYW